MTWAELAERPAGSGGQPFLLYGDGFDAAGPVMQTGRTPDVTETWELGP